MEALRAYLTPNAKKRRTQEENDELSDVESVDENAKDSQEWEPSWAKAMKCMMSSMQNDLAEIKTDIQQAKFQADIAQSIAEEAMDKISELEVKVQQIEVCYAKVDDVKKMIEDAMQNMSKAPVTECFPSDSGDKYSKTLVLGGFRRDSDKKDIEDFINKNIVKSGEKGVEEVYAYRLGSIGFVRFEQAGKMWDFLREFNKQPKPRCNDKDIWATISKTPEERKKGKYLSKSKRVLIEVGLADASNIFVDYNHGALVVNKVRVAEWQESEQKLRFAQTKLTEASITVEHQKLTDAIDDLLQQ